MEWLALIVAGLFEIVWAVGLKYTEGFTKTVPTLWTVAAMVISFFLLSYALRAIPMGTAYAVWTGIGAAGVALFGILYLGESKELIRVACLAIIIVGVIGLKLTHK